MGSATHPRPPPPFGRPAAASGDPVGEGETDGLACEVGDAAGVRVGDAVGDVVWVGRGVGVLFLAAGLGLFFGTGAGGGLGGGAVAMIFPDIPSPPGPPWNMQY